MDSAGDLGMPAEPFCTDCLVKRRARALLRLQPALLGCAVGAHRLESRHERCHRFR